MVKNPGAGLLRGDPRTRTRWDGESSRSRYAHSSPTTRRRGQLSSGSPTAHTSTFSVRPVTRIPLCGYPWVVTVALVTPLVASQVPTTFAAISVRLSGSQSRIVFAWARVRSAVVAAGLELIVCCSPSITRRVPGESGGIGQQWREALHPPVDAEVVDLDATLDQQLLHITVGQAETQVPPDRGHDHVNREPEPGEHRLRRQPRA
jgi:hypothetical protein